MKATLSIAPDHRRRLKLSLLIMCAGTIACRDASRPAAVPGLLQHHSPEDSTLAYYGPIEAKGFTAEVATKRLVAIFPELGGGTPAITDTTVRIEKDNRHGLFYLRTGAIEYIDHNIIASSGGAPPLFSASDAAALAQVWLADHFLPAPSADLQITFPDFQLRAGKDPATGASHTPYYEASATFQLNTGASYLEYRGPQLTIGVTDQGISGAFRVVNLFFSVPQLWVLGSETPQTIEDAEAYAMASGFAPYGPPEMIYQSTGGPNEFLSWVLPQYQYEIPDELSIPALPRLQPTITDLASVENGDGTFTLSYAATGSAIVSQTWSEFMPDAFGSGALGTTNPATFPLPPGATATLVKLKVLDANNNAAYAIRMIEPSAPIAPPGFPALLLSPPMEPPGPGGPGYVTSKKFSNHGWSGEGTITAEDGLRLTDIRLNGDLKITELSMPFYEVETSLLPHSWCELKNPPGGNAAGNCESVLMPPGIQELTGAYTGLKACYRVGKLPQGDCSGALVICEQFAFAPKAGGCAPFPFNGACWQWWPMIAYWWTAPNPPPKGCDTNVFHEFWDNLRVDYDVKIVSNNYLFYKDLDPIPELPKAKDPFPTEMGGETLAEYGDSGTYDNYHVAMDSWSWCPYVTVTDSGLELGKICFPGCKNGTDECAHMHARWGEVASAVSGAWFNKGKVLTPSNQRLRAFAVVYHPGEQHPPPAGGSLVVNLVNGEATAPADLVLWEEYLSVNRTSIFPNFSDVFAQKEHHNIQ